MAKTQRQIENSKSTQIKRHLMYKENITETTNFLNRTLYIPKDNGTTFLNTEI